MGSLTFAGRVVLVVVNIIFLLAALALVICGFILRFAPGVIDVEDALSQLSSSSSSLFGEDVDTSNLDLGVMISAVAIAMIVIGVLFSALSFIGFFSACCNFTTLMLVYECCGVDNYHDFENKGKWKGNTGKPDGNDVVTPIVCCKKMPTDNTQKENCAGKNGVKEEADISPNSNLKKGCVDEAWRVIVIETDAICVTVFALCILIQIN
ncbi:hypothetical protein ACF0H5_012373 [Mactra antiquata]